MSILTLEQFASRGLAPFDLTLAAGECISLSGPSGCGKSLLLRAIADLDPHQGDCLLENERLSETQPQVWRRRVGLLPAESHWWADLVADHFSQPEPHTLELLGFQEDCMKWEVARLSSGERQRLALARLLAGHPRVLLLDEPTANLDATNSRRVESLVREYIDQSGAGALWVSHDPEQCRRVASRGMVFVQGQLRPDPWT